MTSKTEAKKDEFVGDVKDTVGGTVGNETLQGEGKAQNTSGKVEGTLASAQGYVQGAADQVSGTVKSAYNSLAGDTSAETGDTVQQKKGEAQKEINS